MTNQPVRFEDFFAIPQKISLLVGIPLNMDSKNIKKATFWQSFRFWFLFYNLWYAVTAATFDSLGQDILRFTFQIPLNAYAACGLVAVMLIWKNKNRLALILIELNKTYQEQCSGEDQQPIMREILKQTTNIMKRYILLFVILISLFNLVPVYVVWNTYQATGKIQLLLPYYAWFPFDPYANSYIFPIIFIEENIWGVSAITMLVLDVVTLGAIVTQLRLHFDILAKKLRRVKIGDGGEEFNEVIVDERLSEIVKEHQKLIQITDDIADVFSTSLLSNYIWNSFIICMAIFQIVFNKNWEDVIKFVFLFLCVLFQTLALSYYGDQITEYVGGWLANLWNIDLLSNYWF